MHRRLAIDLIVGWSKSIVGNNLMLHLFERLCANSVAVMESRPTGIRGALVSTDVPRVAYATDWTIALLLVLQNVSAELEDG